MFFLSNAWYVAQVKRLKCICMIFQLHDLNARPILNVQTTLHAYKKNVKTLATLIRVVEMLNVKPKIIEQYVFASMDMLETPTHCVKNVRLDILA